MRIVNYILILSLGLTTILTSCKKEKVTHHGPHSPTVDGIDTLYPLDYFPAFPGSYWKYIDSSGDTVVNATDSVYHKNCWAMSSAAYVSDTFFVPFYNGIPIWGYLAHEGPISSSGSYPLRRILSDSLPVGSSWTIYYWGGTGVDRKIISKDTTIVIGTTSYYPTIVIEEYYTSPPIPMPIAKRYYTKNIGLIREDLYNFPDTTINVRLMFDYFINL
jgi:hypothetical protein